MSGNLLVLTSLLALLAGVHSVKEVYVRTGEAVALHCPDFSDSYQANITMLTWSRNTTTQWAALISNTSDEQGQMDVVLLNRSLVILSSSPQHQGNYRCSQGNDSSHFSLMVYTVLPKEHLERTQYPQTCSVEESCSLDCPERNVPPANTQNITSKAIAWHKLDSNSSLEVSGFISSVEEEDQGIYTCTRSYLYQGQTYNLSFTVVLHVEAREKLRRSAEIISPHNDVVYYVDLGSSLVIDCQAVIYSDFGDLYWLSGGSFVEKNSSFPVFFNKTREKSPEKIEMTASLVFRSVSQDELSRRYTCKLQSISQAPCFVTITLTQKALPSSLTLVFMIASIVMIILTVAVVYTRLRVDITLLLRDTLRCRSRNSDGKSHDAYLMCYKSDTEIGLNEDNIRQLENVLEKQFGYSVCVYDHDSQPGKFVTEGVCECVEQSQAVILVPTSLDFGLGTDLLSEIQEALIEQQTRLVCIRTEPIHGEISGSSVDTLWLLRKAGQDVTWERSNSLSPSSRFLKNLRYHLPPPCHAPIARPQEENC